MMNTRSSPSHDMPKTVFGFGSSAPRHCNKPTVTPPPAKLSSAKSGRAPSPTSSSPARLSPPRRLSSSPRRSFSPNQSQFDPVSPAPSSHHLRSNAYSPSQSMVESLSRPLPFSRPAFGSTGPRLAPTTPSPVKPRLPYSRGTVVGSSRGSPSGQLGLTTLRPSYSHTHSLNGSPGTTYSEEGEPYAHSHHDQMEENERHEDTNMKTNDNENKNVNDKKSADEDESPAEKVSLPQTSAQSSTLDDATAIVTDALSNVSVNAPAATVEPVSVPTSEPAQTTSEEPVSAPHKIVVYSNEDQGVKGVRELDLDSPAHNALRQHIADFELGVSLEEDVAEAVLSSLFRERRPFCAEEICECRAYKTDFKASSEGEKHNAAFLAQLFVAGERAASAVVIFDKSLIAVAQLRFDEETNNEVH